MNGNKEGRRSLGLLILDPPTTATALRTQGGSGNDATPPSLVQPLPWAPLPAPCHQRKVLTTTPAENARGQLGWAEPGRGEEASTAASGHGVTGGRPAPEWRQEKRSGQSHAAWRRGSGAQVGRPLQR